VLRRFIQEKKKDLHGLQQTRTKSIAKTNKLTNNRKKTAATKTEKENRKEDRRPRRPSNAIPPPHPSRRCVIEEHLL
jgi:hypothetical protein